VEPIYTRADAAAAGMTRAQLRDDGRRISRGVYLSRALPVNLPDMAQAVLAVCPPGAAASHRTAATLLGAPVDAARPVEVVVPPGAYRPRRRGVRVHVRDLAPADLGECQGVPVTSGAQTLLDLAARTAAAELVAIGDALYRAGVLDAESLAERLARADGCRGIVTARRCAPLLTPAAASRPESLIRYAILDSHLPPPAVQLPIRDRRGRPVAHADLGYEEWRIAIEYEGRQHAEREQFARDLTRYSLMAASGWLLLRFGGADAFRPQVVVSRVEGALRSRGATW
jgi:hypothetical protein